MLGRPTCQRSVGALSSGLSLKPPGASLADRHASRCQTVPTRSSKEECFQATMKCGVPTIHSEARPSSSHFAISAWHRELLEIAGLAILPQSKQFFPDCGLEEWVLRLDVGRAEANPVLAHTRGTQAPPQSRLALVETHRDSSKGQAEARGVERRRGSSDVRLRPVRLRTRAAATPAMPPPTIPTTAADFDAIA